MRGIRVQFLISIRFQTPSGYVCLLRPSGYIDNYTQTSEFQCYITPARTSIRVCVVKSWTKQLMSVTQEQTTMQLVFAYPLNYNMHLRQQIQIITVHKEMPKQGGFQNLQHGLAYIHGNNMPRCSGHVIYNKEQPQTCLHYHAMF